MQSLNLANLRLRNVVFIVVVVAVVVAKVMMGNVLFVFYVSQCNASTVCTVRFFDGRVIIDGGY